MNKRLSLLMGIMLVQLLLIGLVNLTRGAGDSSAAFLDIDESAVTGLTISDAEGQMVSLERTDAGWRLDGGLPANSAKVMTVIESLAAQSASWPVATSANSQNRFEVTEALHQRRLQLSADDEMLADVFLGTSPGFRRVHAREAATDSIFSIDFAVHEAPTARGDWLNKSLLQTEEISSVVFPAGEILSRQEDGSGWLLDGSATDAEAVGVLIERIERLSVLGFYDPDKRQAQEPDLLADLDEQLKAGDKELNTVEKELNTVDKELKAVDKELKAVDKELKAVDKELKAVDKELKAPATLTVEDAQGRYQLTFRHDEVEDEYVLSTDRFEGQFLVASYIVEQLLVDVADLNPAAEERVDESAEESSTGSAEQ
jgi:hypothetical protein